MEEEADEEAPAHPTSKASGVPMGPRASHTGPENNDIGKPTRYGPRASSASTEAIADPPFTHEAQDREDALWLTHALWSRADRPAVDSNLVYLTEIDDLV